jgi:hypothetical protein
MGSHFESKNWSCEHYGIKLISGNPVSQKSLGFPKLDIFFVHF